MLNNKDYCDYETCVALKELGYSESFPLSKDYEVLGKDYDILLYEAQKWLREEKGFDIVVKPLDKTTLFMGGEKYFWMVYLNHERVSGLNVPCTITYEEALSEGVRQAVKILKEK